MLPCFQCPASRACRESKISDSWVANQFKIWFESWFKSTMICESRKICESLMIFESKFHSFYLIKDLRINVKSRINLELNHFKKNFESTFSLGLSKKIATSFESQIIVLDSRQALPASWFIVGLVANLNQWFEIRISLVFFWRARERKLIRIFFFNDSIQDWFANQRWFANLLLNKNHGFLIRESSMICESFLICDSRIRNFWFVTSSNS